MTFGCAIVLYIVFFVGHLEVVHAGNAAFLHTKDHHIHVVTDILEELENATSAQHRVATERRVGRLQAVLEPMFKALPKDINGTLSPSGVRYLLHRLFVQRHGWSVNGLYTSGDSWSSSSPSAVFKGHAESHHSLFHGRLSDHGFDLHQVAVFAATLETLVHTESRSRLEWALKLHGLSMSSGVLQENETMSVIAAYMIVYVASLDTTYLDRETYENNANNILDIYPTWPDTAIFMNEVRNRVLEDVPKRDRNSVDTTLMVLEEIGEVYGRWQDKECRVMKNQLVELEQPGTGRVRLHDFYAPRLTNRSWRFIESLPYLHNQGAIDDSDPKQLTVIIPNYVNALTNCVAGSKFYSVCCIDECENLLATLEYRIEASHASAARILAYVSELPSDTTEAPRILPDSLTQRLNELERFHGGRVPLHGRLFAQWLHHAFPRECPYPHVFGTTAPVGQEEWNENHEEIIVTDEEIKAIIADAKAVGMEFNQALPWVDEEELFIVHHKLPPSQGFTANCRNFLLMLVGLFGIVVRYGKGASVCAGSKSRKYTV